MSYRQKRRRILALALTAILFAWTVLGVVFPRTSAEAQPAAAGSHAAEGTTTVEGELTVLAVDAKPKQTAYPSVVHYQLKTADGTIYQLAPDSALSFQTGQRLRVTGGLEHQGQQLLLRHASAQPLLSPGAATATPSSAATTATTGHRTILVILANLSSPDFVTPASAQDVVGNTDRAFFQQSSFGKFDLTATTTPWLSVPDASCSQADDLSTKAQAAAAAAGYDPTAYDHIMIYFPFDGACPWGGIGDVDGTTTWINGDMQATATVHELGHNLGLLHSGSISCHDDSGQQVPLSDDCTDNEYGDAYDPMAWVGELHDFNAFEKHQLGWLDGPPVELPSATSTTAQTTLAPVELQTGSTQLVTAHGWNNTYYIEYRQPLGLDADLPTDMLGVVVRTTQVPAGDTPPGSSVVTMDHDKVPMAPNSSYETPDGVTITLGTPTSQGAPLTVDVDPVGTSAVSPTKHETIDSSAGPFGMYFTTTMNAASLGGAFQLTRQGSTVPAPGTTTYSDVRFSTSDEHIFSFYASSWLLPGVTYTATMSTAATSAAGVHLREPVTWDFTTTGPNPITDRYNALGNSALLGSAVGVEYPLSDGWAQDYQRGRIYWDHYDGAHVVTGAVLSKYAALGGPAKLGFPVNDTSATADRVGQFNDFGKSMSIYWTPTTGAHEIGGDIRDRWFALGTRSGLPGDPKLDIGYPTTDETTTPDGVGRFNHFSKDASIYWSPSTGAHEIGGLIRSHWAAMGWERSILGYPTTDELVADYERIGRFNNFSNGASIYWSPSTGAHEIGGLIRSRWAAAGSETGILGYPITDETTTPDLIGRFNHFSKSGSIYWTPGTGAHAVTGAIRAKWASLGWERSRYGYPTGEVYPVTGGQRQNFQHGYLTLIGGVVR